LLGELDTDLRTRALITSALAEHGLLASPDLRGSLIAADSVITVRAQPARADVSIGGVAVAALAGGAMIVAALLPFAGKTSLGQTFLQNTFIDHDGWAFIGVGAMIVITALNARQRRTATRAPFVFGGIAVVVAVLVGSSQSLRTAHVIGAAGTIVLPLGVGFQIAAVASAVALAGGVVIRKSPRIKEATAPTTTVAEPTKRCPDCAETVLAAARVCKHCHHRFETG
jgi:hypothetical protein